MTESRGAEDHELRRGFMDEQHPLPGAHSAAGAPRPGAAPLEVFEHSHTEEEEEDEDDGYGVDHLSAVIRPVALTMVLAAIAVAKIRDPAQDASVSSGLSMYLVYNENGGSGGGGSSTGDMIGQAIVNAVVIVCVIAAATFVLVACYYFRCLKLMLGYLIFACVNLLGYSGGFMVITAVTVYHVIFDYATLAFLMLNFAVGGAVAVFWQKGVPRVITQGYLVAVSVIMCWILTKLPEWTSWALLVALAVYDLCAVLTPCGPLKWLVNLAQTRQDPIPGLLYEANVGPSRDTDVRDTFASGSAQPKRGGARSAAAAAGAPGAVAAVSASGIATMLPPSSTTTTLHKEPASSAAAVAGGAQTAHVAQWGGMHKDSATDVFTADSDNISGAGTTTVLLPLAPLKSSFRRWDSAPVAGGNGEEGGSAGAPRHAHAVTGGVTSTNKTSNGVASSGSSTVFKLNPASAALSSASSSSVASSARPPHIPAAVLAAVAADDAELGTVAALALAEEEEAETRRRLASEEEARAIEEEEEAGGRSIKLGLGDFVFYSVLVSRAALFDVSTFAASFVAVLMGLGGTLFLLSVYKKALPALPISIFLGVAFYFVTRLVITPMIVQTSLQLIGL